ncbi:hypothetical protein NVP1121O_210 [Vibrio phage 1.121.O._10N.286.46.C4]|nr:hypothetical protein NVP1121O_210 [Vibrio phage 1.121.O._10N.286.46.C4]
MTSHEYAKWLLQQEDLPLVTWDYNSEAYKDLIKGRTFKQYRIKDSDIRDTYTEDELVTFEITDEVEPVWEIQ